MNATENPTYTFISFEGYFHQVFDYHFCSTDYSIIIDKKLTFDQKGNLKMHFELLKICQYIVKTIKIDKDKKITQGGNNLKEEASNDAKTNKKYRLEVLTFV